MIAWHFLASPTQLRDGSPVAAVGSCESYTGPIEPCESGLHASASLLDALRYAPGPWVRIVRLAGTIVPHGDPVDKHVASERWPLTEPIDVSRILYEFACQCAERALTREREAGREPAPESWAAIAARRRWLAGEATDAEVAVAAAAAKAAATYDPAAVYTVYAATEVAHTAYAAAAYAAAEATYAAAEAAYAAAEATYAAAEAAAKAARIAEQSWQEAELHRLLVAAHPAFAFAFAANV